MKWFSKRRFGIKGIGFLLLCFSFSCVSREFSDALKKAEAGDVAAQNEIGDRYRKGNGVQINYSKAISWYEKSANQGFAPAQASLGEMYSKGQGVSLDYAEALKWFQNAADQGNGDGQSDLGRLYLLGLG